MKIKSLIIDDNPFITDLLSDMLQQDHPVVEVMGIARNGTEAIEKINTLRPELIFLDVEMPDMTGFEVLANLGAINFQTIFITSFSHYAVRAIRFNALDYLIKPIDPKELANALKRFQTNRHTGLNQSQVQTAIDNLEKENAQERVLYLPTQEGGFKMVLRDIVYIEGDRNYSTIHLTNGKTKLSSKTLGYFEELLTQDGFFRCHRSYLVNHAHVNKINNNSIVLTGQQTLPISRRRKVKTKEWFQGSAMEG